MTEERLNSDIFPIPLTPFELYFFWDGTADYPMLMEGAFHLRGNLQKSDFESAVRAALKKHPLFLAKVEKQGKNYFWVDAEREPEIEWLESPLDLENHAWNFSVDLLKQNVFQLSVYSSEQTAIVYYGCHHIYADQTGFCRFMSDVFTQYAKLQGAEIEEQSTVQPERIVDRGKLNPPALPVKLGPVQIAWETLKAIGTWMVEKPIPVGEALKTFAGSRFGKQTELIPGDWLSALKTEAKSKNCTVNDYLLALLLSVVANWQTKQTSKSKGKHLRVNIPVNLRLPGSEGIPASNILSYVFLTRTLSDCVNNSNLLSGIRDEMKFLKEMQVSYVLLDTLNFLYRIPGGIRWITQGKKCLASFVLSNLGVLGKVFGKPFIGEQGEKVDFGGLVLDRLEWYVPCRHKTHLTFAVSQQSSELVISCQYDKNYVSEEDFRSIFNDFRGKIAEIQKSRDIKISPLNV